MLFFSTHVHIFKRHITCTTRIGMKGSKISGKNAPQHSISTMQMEHTDRFIRRFGMAFLSKIRSQQEKRETDTNKAGTLFGAGLHPHFAPNIFCIELRSRREHDAMSHNYLRNWRLITIATHFYFRAYIQIQQVLKLLVLNYI